MARFIPLLPAPRGNLPVPYAQPPEIVEASAALLPTRRAKPGVPALPKADPRYAQRRRVSRWVCDRYRADGAATDRGLLCDVST
jgi:hypothetical protein